MNVNFVKISAINGYVRLATIVLEDKTYTFRCSDEMYCHLKRLGVPTAQKLRYAGRK